MVLQKLYTEEVFFGWFNQLAAEKVIPNYPLLGKKAQTETCHDLVAEE